MAAFGDVGDGASEELSKGKRGHKGGTQIQQD